MNTEYISNLEVFACDTLKHIAYDAVTQHFQKVWPAGTLEQQYPNGVNSSEPSVVSKLNDFLPIYKTWLQQNASIPSTVDQLPDTLLFHSLELMFDIWASNSVGA